MLLAFLLFIGILFYFKVPSKIGEMLDGRSSAIKSELDEAKALREEAQSLLASYERKQKEVQDQADRIVSAAKEEATAAADQARADLDGISTAAERAGKRASKLDNFDFEELAPEATADVIRLARDE